MASERTKRELFAFTALITATLVAALMLLLAGPSPAGPAPASAQVAPEAGIPLTAQVKQVARATAKAKPAPKLRAHANKPLGFATWETSGAVRKVEIRGLTPAEISATNKSDE